MEVWRTCGSTQILFDNTLKCLRQQYCVHCTVHANSGALFQFTLQSTAKVCTPLGQHKRWRDEVIQNISCKDFPFWMWHRLFSNNFSNPLQPSCFISSEQLANRINLWITSGGLYFEFPNPPDKIVFFNILLLQGIIYINGTVTFLLI